MYIVTSVQYFDSPTMKADVRTPEINGVFLTHEDAKKSVEKTAEIWINNLFAKPDRCYIDRNINRLKAVYRYGYDSINVLIVTIHEI